MSKIEKFRKGGFKWLFNSISIRMKYKLNNYYFYHYQKKLPIQENLIVMESEGDLSDNAYALYDYMRENGYLKKYQVVWLVDNISVSRKENFPNTSFVYKNRYIHLDRKANKALATCKWYIFDHNNEFIQIDKRREQKVIYLSHGWGYKAAKGNVSTKSFYDAITVTGDIPAKGMALFWNEPLSKTIITGYPRLDYFFKNNKVTEEKVNKKYHFDKYKKVIYWMPTFRQSTNKELSEDYLQNQTGLPIFETRESLKEFSEFLKKQNVLLVFKLHHLQAHLPVFKDHFENILIVKDEEIKQLGMQLYQFINLSDAMISDYSSISVDYLLKDRPIIFTLDDYEQYDKSRGLIPQNAIDYMPGYHVYNQKELEESILEILQGIDSYKEERKKLLPLYHKYNDGKSSQRVLNAIGIKN